jgi:hypothetical protein
VAANNIVKPFGGGCLLITDAGTYRFDSEEQLEAFDTDRRTKKALAKSLRASYRDRPMTEERYDKELLRLRDAYLNGKLDVFDYVLAADALQLPVAIPGQVS